MKKAAVIGAGIGGLGAAVRLAKAGYKVTVFEANGFAGGKINSRTLGPYRFDMGPSVFTCPEYVKELYDLCGKDFREFEYQKLPETFTYFFPDGQQFKLPNNREDLLNVLANELGEDRTTIEKYLQKAGKNYRLIAPLFIESSLHKWGHLLNKNLLKALWNLPSYKLNSTMDQENRNAFKNPKTVQLFNRFASYNGSSPFETPAMLNMISHLELNDGAYLPKNGMVQIAEKIKALAIEQGVEFVFNTKVDEIIVHNKKAVGVRYGSTTFHANVVFSNMDIAYTYTKLLPGERHPRKILAQEKSSSAVVFYLGVRKTFNQLGVHNIFFSADYKEEYRHIFHKKEVYHDPTVYLNITSKEVPGDAPVDGENWFLMINAPINTGQDWQEYTQRVRTNMINKVSRFLGEDIRPYIEVEEVMNPILIEDWYSGKQGSIYGNSSNSKFAAFYRHPNFSKHIKNLYFVGVTVHPGGGIPLALNSAKIAVRCLLESK